MEQLPDQPTQVQADYAGFWLRLAAYIIDYFVIGFVLGGIVVFVGLAMGISAAAFDDIDNSANQLLIITLSTVLGIVSLVATWLYYALLECSSYQGTLGKMALSLKVTDMDGARISFSRATGRFFGKFLSSLILYVGYFMIGFTERKQGLHDILSGCLVLRK
ncbi:MAG: hypothetical protein DHS20C17_26690 [Cyclobacteriaceae bacterium]|nr:MAG: hypothetical protein DHS20C17_26690 [Cyclobacteriaceae bacterium]